MKNQQGAALFVSLIILLVLSIIGISAMRGGLLQSLIAANSQQAELTFNAADAGVGAAVSSARQTGIQSGILADSMTLNGDLLTMYVDEEGVLQLDEDVYFDAERDEPVINVQTDVSYIGIRKLWCRGGSIKEGTSNLSTGCHAFQIDSTGTVAGSQSQVSQWVAAKAAASSSLTD